MHLGNIRLTRPCPARQPDAARDAAREDSHRAEARKRCAVPPRDARVRGRSHGHGEELGEREDRHHRGVRPILTAARTPRGQRHGLAHGRRGSGRSPLLAHGESFRRCANNRTPVPAVAIFDRPPERSRRGRPAKPPPPPAHTKATDREKTFPRLAKVKKRTRFLSDAPPLLPVLPNRRSSRRATAPGVTSTSAMTCSACPPPTPAAWAAATANTRAGSARSRRSPCTRSSAALRRATATLTPVTARTTGRITPAGARTRARARTSSTAGATA